MHRNIFQKAGFLAWLNMRKRISEMLEENATERSSLNKQPIWNKGYEKVATKLKTQLYKLIDEYGDEDARKIVMADKL